MVDILHRVGVLATPDQVYDALTTIDGLAGWWTEDTKGDPTPDGTIEFRFEGAPPPAGFDIRVLDTTPARRVGWQVEGGPDEWIDTKITFELAEEDGFTIILFSHTDWREAGPFMHHCSTKWATFLLSLKQLAETGTGEPAPNDVKISNWH